MINLGNAKINKFKTDSKITYDAIEGQTITLKDGHATINDKEMDIGKTYTLCGGDKVTIFSGDVEQFYT